MANRLVVPRLSEGSVAIATESESRLASPGVHAIEIVYGVGDGPGERPTEDAFHPTYTIAMPVHSLGGLDPDGVHECDAASVLRTLQDRATRRRWAMRVELVVDQAAATVTAADLYIERDEPDAAGLRLLGPGHQGQPRPGGGRQLRVATDLVHEPERVTTLGGAYRLQLCDADPQQPGASARSPVRVIRLGLDRFEFE